MVTRFYDVNGTLLVERIIKQGVLVTHLMQLKDLNFDHQKMQPIISKNI